MDGRYSASPGRESGKAIGIEFIGTITYGEILEQYGHKGIDFGISPDCFNNDSVFVQFNKVVPVNTGGRACGICNYVFYAATPDNFNTLAEEDQWTSCGGYKFFEINKKKVEDKNLRGIYKKKAKGIAINDLISYTGKFLGGRLKKIKRRRTLRRKTRSKTRKTKRKLRKRRRKRKTIKKRRRKNAKK